MTNTLLAFGVIAAFALIGAGVWGLRQAGPKLKPWLMIAAGLVTLFNIWVFTLPVA
jgi:hypothetical protein